MLERIHYEKPDKDKTETIPAGNTRGISPPAIKLNPDKNYCKPKKEYLDPCSNFSRALGLCFFPPSSRFFNAGSCVAKQPLRG
jgi:hypothetical protein